MSALGPSIARLGSALNAYVAKACEGRDPSHGLAHMQIVAQKAMGLLTMHRASERALAIIDGLLAIVDDAAVNSDEKKKEDDILTSLASLVSLMDGDEKDNASTSLPTAAACLLSKTIRPFIETYMAAAVCEADAALTHVTSIYEGIDCEEGGKKKGIFTKALAFSSSAAASQEGGKNQQVEAAGQLVLACVAYSMGAKQALTGCPITVTAATGSSSLTCFDVLLKSCGWGDSDTDTAAAQQQLLVTEYARCVAIAMLHDVNDHKYERPDGSLSAGLEAFVKGELCGEFASVLFPPSSSPPSSPADADTIMRTISAISFSKEKKRGKGYFADELGEAWLVVRNIVSDADKLEAIGEGGLLRCWHYSFEVREGKMGGKAAARALLEADAALKESVRQSLFTDVTVHVGEKLAILKDEYIVTNAGKRVAALEHDRMLALLEAWKRTEPPQLLLCE